VIDEEHSLAPLSLMLVSFLVCFGAMVYPHAFGWLVGWSIELLGYLFPTVSSFENVRGLVVLIEVLLVSLVLMAPAVLLVPYRGIIPPVLYGVSGVGYLFIYRAITMHSDSSLWLVLDLFTNLQTSIVFCSIAAGPALSYMLLCKLIRR